MIWSVNDSQGSFKVKFWRKLHKWVGLVVALQVLFWISGGVVMTVIPIDMVRGQHLIARADLAPRVHELGLARTFDMSQHISAQWVMRLGETVLKVVTLEGETRYLSAQDFSQLPPLTAEQAKSLAQSSYLGEGQAINVKLLQQMPPEAKRLEPPVYRVDFDDWLHTSFYVLPESGRIPTVRSDLWRLFDFFWMLHIMDYEEREDFNNPLLISAAVISLLFTFSGLCLLYFSLVKPRIKQWHYKLAKSH